MADQSAVKPIPHSYLAPMLSQVIDLLPIGMWVTDKTGKLIYGNKEVLAIWGGARYVDQTEYGQFKAWTVPEHVLVTPETAAPARAINNGEVIINEELEIETFDGQKKRILNSAIPIKNPEGEVTSCLLINQDITSLRNSESRLVETIKTLETKVQETEMFKLAVDQAAEHIIITNPDGVILYANHGVEKITGYSRAEVIGTKAGKLWSKPMEPEFYIRMWDTIKNKKQMFEGEIQNRRKNGQLYTSLATISPILDSEMNVQFFLGLERDISKEKQIDQAKSDFVSFASHQLRTPLTAVRWYTEMLLSGDAGAVNPDQQKYLNEVYSGSNRMIELVSALLNVSRIEMGTFSIEPEPTDICEVVSTVIEEADVIAKHNEVKVESELSAIPVIQVDRKLISIVFENLITNAIKYSKPGGTVHISMSTNEQAVTRNGQEIPAASLFFEINDQGIGIPPHQQEKMFSKLFRADNAIIHDTNGNGLGLYITRSIIEHSGGRIWFTSQENQGTTFTFWLPINGMSPQEGSRRLESMHG